MKKLFSTRTSESAFSFAMLVLRVGAGSLMMINHGLDKLMHFSQKAANFADPFGIGSTASLSMVIFAEFFCSIFIILGLFTRLAAILMMVDMLFICFVVGGGKFYYQDQHPFLFAMIALVFFFTGPARWSLDARLFGSGSADMPVS